MSHAPTDAVQECETLLRKMVEDLRAKRIWPNLCSIIDGLLNRRIELAEVHKEVHAALAQTPRALYMFWDVFLHAADGWNPQKNRAARQAREELVGVNRRISEIADQLAALLDRRDTIHNSTGFRSNTHYHILDIVHEASEHDRDGVGYLSYFFKDQEGSAISALELFFLSVNEVVEAHLKAHSTGTIVPRAGYHPHRAMTTISAIDLFPM